MNEREFKQQARQALGQLIADVLADKPEMHQFVNTRTGASAFTDAPDKYRARPAEWYEVPKRPRLTVVK
jgi:hypothetical protein